MDHERFPHLVDGIISYSSLATLAAIRSTSRYFRDRVTPLLYAHCLAEYSIIMDQAVEALYAVNMFPGRQPRQRTRLPPRPAPVALQFMRTLEIVGAGVPRVLERFLRSKECKLSAVRLHPKAAGWYARTDIPRAATLVLIGNVTFPDHIRPHEVSKVVHLNPPLSDLPSLNAFHLNYQGLAPHVVVHCVTADLGGGPNTANKRGSSLAIFVVLLLAGGQRFCLKRRIVLVGLDEVDPHSLGLVGCDITGEGDAEDYADTEMVNTQNSVDIFKKVLMSRKTVSIATGLLGGDAVELLASVEYPTVDEYKKSLSHEDFAVETIAHSI
jgi:hypothetical protein